MDLPVIKIYNSLTKEKTVFNPVNPPNVNMYSCGVTVYDDCHIGHARSLYIFDIIRKYLKFRGFKVNFVRNITDIDDKIINRANELKFDWKELVSKYIKSYYEDLGLLGIEKGDSEPRATENIDGMKNYIKNLIDKGYAYMTDSGVYFSVRKFSDYGKLSNQSIDQMLTGVRKDADEAKDDPLDFALWKKSKPNEPSWESPWGPGRPGWHIECSVMSAKFLKTDTLDIHAGGRDLIFPHHENEIAQSEALTGKPFANYWIHHGLLTINGQKMSKSLGNFVTIKDFVKQNKFSIDALKIFFLQTHYSQSIDFTWERIEEKQRAINRIVEYLKIVERRKLSDQVVSFKRNKQVSADEIHKRIDFYVDSFKKNMDDDFNMPQALASLFEMVNYCNPIIHSDNYSKKHLEELIYAKDKILELGGILGLSLKPDLLVLTENERELIKKRDEYKLTRNFSEADKIKNILKSKGIILRDNKDGSTTFERI